MAETITEREYVIPLRRVWLHVPQYRRSGKAIKAIKEFIAKHMKVENRDVEKVKLDVYLNNELWFRGRANPPSKVKVKARKDGAVVHVTFVETPESVKFLKAKHERFHKAGAKSGVEAKPADHPAKTAEQKKDESEKEKAVAEHNLKEAAAAAKAEKHVTPVKEPQIQRMALKK